MNMLDADEIKPTLYLL